MRGYGNAASGYHDHIDFLMHDADSDALYLWRFDLLGLFLELSRAADLHGVAECDGGSCGTGQCWDLRAYDDISDKCYD